MSKICNAGKKYGLTVRVKQEIDLRRFRSIPREPEGWLLASRLKSDDCLTTSATDAGCVAACRLFTL